jgi:GTP-binding protein
MFYDEARIFVRGGKGGNGMAHFHREKFQPRGGPDGGDGGRGGSVYLVVDPSLNSLLFLNRTHRYVAEPGKPGSTNRRQGAAGKDVQAMVPPGTVVSDATSGQVIADLRHTGDRMLAARGGRGGLGNVHFTTSTRQAPNFAQKGEPPEERLLDLELQLIADIGIVGLPNAGKSSLLARISAARPKVAEYPFTTLQPELGVVQRGNATLVFADIPGLIAGAHAGAGLGHTFLRHIRRTRLLLHLVDCASLEEHDPVEVFHQVNDELRQFDSTLLDKPQIVALNKLDVTEARERFEIAKPAIESESFAVVGISAVSGKGIDELLGKVFHTYEASPTTREEVVSVIVPEVAIPVSDDFAVARRGDRFVVSGKAAVRLAAMADLSKLDGLLYFQQRLDRMGITAALEKAGAQAGSTVVIGPLELEWQAEP